MTAKFPLGRTVATPAALDFLQRSFVSPSTLLARHAQGDWGDLDDEDLQRNEEALLLGSRLFSAYQVGSQKVWVITEADRSATTILLPEDY